MPPDRWGPRGPLEGPPYDYYGGPRGGPLAPPMYSLRRCSDSPGPPMLRIAYYGRGEERDGGLGGLSDPRGPPRLLQRRVPPDQLQQLHAHEQQQQQYYTEMRRRPPSSAWRARRRSLSSRGSSNSSKSCGVDRQGPPGAPRDRRGSLGDRERKMCACLSALTNRNYCSICCFCHPQPTAAGIYSVAAIAVAGAEAEA